MRRVEQQKTEGIFSALWDFCPVFINSLATGPTVKYSLEGSCTPYPHHPPPITFLNHPKIAETFPQDGRTKRAEQLTGKYTPFSRHMALSGGAV